MSEKVQAAFIFVAPETDPSRHRSSIETPILNLTIVGVSTYKQGAEEAKKLADAGVKAIELCAGFGNEGTAMVAKAVKGIATVGAVRFDHHPGFDFKSDDDLFNN